MRDLSFVCNWGCRCPYLDKNWLSGKKYCFFHSLSTEWSFWPILEDISVRFEAKLKTDMTWHALKIIGLANFKTSTYLNEHCRIIFFKLKNSDSNGKVNFATSWWLSVHEDESLRFSLKYKATISRLRNLAIYWLLVQLFTTVVRGKQC